MNLSQQIREGALRFARHKLQRAKPYEGKPPKPDPEDASGPYDRS